MPRGICRRTSVRWAAMAIMAIGTISNRPVFSQAPPSGVEPPRPSEQIIPIVAKDSRVSLIELQTRIIELSSKIKSVDGHDPDILTVIPISNHRLRLKAEKAGVTTFTLTDEFDNVHQIEVFVDADVRELQAYLGRLFPGAAVEVVGINGSVVLRGWVTEPTQINQITDVAEKFAPGVLNQMSVAGVSQIQLQVKVMEVQRSKLREFGFNFLYSDANVEVGIVPALVSDPTVTASVIGSSSLFEAFIKAVETNSLAKVLADTALVVNSGRPATLHAGGEFPILVPQPGAGTTTFSIQYKEFGVRMEAVAVVLGNGKVRMQIAPEVSERDFSSAVVLGGVSVPGISIRRVNTEVEMRFGETLMLGGLMLQRDTESRTKIPYLGDLPWIGSAFSTRKSEVGETELLIMLTPQMAAPIAPGQLPIMGPGQNTEPPSNVEFYRDGFMEIPNYNPSTEPIGGTFDVEPPYPTPSMATPALPGQASPPVVEPQITPAPAPTPASDNAVTQTSGIKNPEKRGRGLTLGSLRSFGPNRDHKTSDDSASVRSNAGAQVQGTPGNAAAALKDNRIRLTEPTDSKTR